MCLLGDETTCNQDSPCYVPLSSCKLGQGRAYGWCSAHNPQWCEGCPPPTQFCPDWSPPEDLHALLCPQRCYTPQPGRRRDSIERKLKHCSVDEAHSMSCYMNSINPYHYKFLNIYLYIIMLNKGEDLFDWFSFDIVQQQIWRMLFCLLPQDTVHRNYHLIMCTLQYINQNYTCSPSK